MAELILGPPSIENICRGVSVECFDEKDTHLPRVIIRDPEGKKFAELVAVVSDDRQVTFTQVFPKRAARIEKGE